MTLFGVNGTSYDLVLSRCVVTKLDQH